MFNLNSANEPFKLNFVEPSTDKKNVPNASKDVLTRVKNLLRIPRGGGKVGGTQLDPRSESADFVIDHMTKLFEKTPAAFVDTNTGNVNQEAVNNYCMLLAKFYTSVLLGTATALTTIHAALDKELAKDSGKSA